MAKKNVAFIVNPISGTQDKEDIVRLIPRFLDKDKFDYQIARTDYSGHATTLTKEWVDNGLDAVIAIGGDGTVNEIARALVHTSTALGIIPSMTGTSTKPRSMLTAKARSWAVMLIATRFLFIILSYSTSTALIRYITARSWPIKPAYIRPRSGLRSQVSRRFLASSTRAGINGIK